ncbi:uncharacterized protein [Asterias amurensis]|uniref:uncharacterized protein n=1 Tax=Asterias amurensis TaxID=7602 RepID=UPI003AB3DE24
MAFHVVIVLMMVVCLPKHTIAQPSVDTTSTCATSSGGASGTRGTHTISTVLELSTPNGTSNIVAKQKATCSFCGENAPPTVEETSCSCTESALVRELNDVIATLRESVDRLTDRLEGQQVATVRTDIEDFDYPVIELDGARWRRFWWYTANSAWPESATDVLQDAYGDCNANSSYCFSRLPSTLNEYSTEMLGRDSAGTVYRWSFNPNNDVAHAVWQAFHSHEEVKILNGNVWAPKVVSGPAPSADQDSFQYREEHGVKSLQIDDDTCDCLTSLSLGHGMCLTGFSTAYGPENVYGVDLLYDSHCQTPSPANGLSLYFKDDDDCTDARCPDGFRCSDGIYAYNCISA